MKKSLASIAILAFLTGGFCATSIAGAGPAPNCGDGVSDGSGLSMGGTRDNKGAPNSGDGVSDGSGLSKGGTRDNKGAPNSGDGVSDGSGK